MENEKNEMNEDLETNEDWRSRIVAGFCGLFQIMIEVSDLDF